MQAGHSTEGVRKGLLLGAVPRECLVGVLNLCELGFAANPVLGFSLDFAGIEKRLGE